MTEMLFFSCYDVCTGEESETCKEIILANRNVDKNLHDYAMEWIRWFKENKPNLDTYNLRMESWNDYVAKKMVDDNVPVNYEQIGQAIQSILNTYRHDWDNASNEQMLMDNRFFNGGKRRKSKRKSSKRKSSKKSSKRKSSKRKSSKRKSSKKTSKRKN